MTTRKSAMIQIPTGGEVSPVEDMADLMADLCEVAGRPLRPWQVDALRVLLVDHRHDRSSSAHLNEWVNTNPTHPDA